MKFDVLGRIGNMRLPDGRTALLYSIYEAVSNAIQAIEERFGRADFSKRGAINILVDLHSDKSLNYVAISDNGIGLNPIHLKSFDTCDTRQKYSLGGKGVGRLIWIKVFDNIQVKSTYETGLDGHEQVAFKFEPTLENSLVNLKKTSGEAEQIGTQIMLAGIKPDQNAGITRSILSRQICHHFFPYFIAGSMPRLNVTFGRRDLDIVEFLSSRVDKQKEEEIDVPIASVGKIHVSHVYVDKSISQELSNAILLTAQGRVVENIEIEKKFALKGLDNGKAYVCVVKSDFLDARVDQERTGFKTLKSEMETITQKAIESAERFLEAHIAGIRKVQKRLVIEILEEHPQLAISVKDVDGYVAELSPSMSEEDIGKTLFTLLYLHERKIKVQINSIANDHNGSQSGDRRREQIDELVQKITDDAKRRLAEYTIKRHQIIQLARSLLKYRDDETETYHWERTLACCRFRRHRVRCFIGTGGGSWRGGSLHASSSLRRSS